MNQDQNPGCLKSSAALPPMPGKHKSIAKGTCLFFFFFCEVRPDFFLPFGGVCYDVLLSQTNQLQTNVSFLHIPKVEVKKHY